MPRAKHKRVEEIKREVPAHKQIPEAKKEKLKKQLQSVHNYKATKMRNDYAECLMDPTKYAARIPDAVIAKSSLVRLSKRLNLKMTSPAVSGTAIAGAFVGICPEYDNGFYGNMVPFTRNTTPTAFDWAIGGYIDPISITPSNTANLFPGATAIAPFYFDSWQGPSGGAMTEQYSQVRLVGLVVQAYFTGNFTQNGGSFHVYSQNGVSGFAEKTSAINVNLSAIDAFPTAKLLPINENRVVRVSYFPDSAARNTYLLHSTFTNDGIEPITHTIDSIADYNHLDLYAAHPGEIGIFMEGCGAEASMEITVCAVYECQPLYWQQGLGVVPASKSKSDPIAYAHALNKVADAPKVTTSKAAPTYSMTQHTESVSKTDGPSMGEQIGKAVDTTSGLVKTISEIVEGIAMFL